MDRNNNRILLVEDDSANILVASSLLEILGYPYELAASGKEALERLGKESFDLIFTDVQMPDMDGYSLARAIREREAKAGQPRVPIISMTAKTKDGERERGLEAGMDDYIAKPFSVETFQ